MPATAAQRAQQGELGLPLPRVQPAIQGDAGGAGQGESQEHDHQQSAPTGVGQRFFPAPGRLFLGDHDLPAVHAELGDPAGGVIGGGQCGVQVSRQYFPVQPNLAGSSENPATVAVGVVHELTQIGDYEGL